MDYQGPPLPVGNGSQVEIRLATLAGETIFVGQGRNTALEVNGDLNQLLAMS